jgi:hypothetical protein
MLAILHRGDVAALEINEHLLLDGDFGWKDAASDTIHAVSGPPSQAVALVLVRQNTNTRREEIALAEVG